MTISNYGCWKGTPISYTAQTLQQDKSPHIDLKFSSDPTSNTNPSGTTEQAHTDEKYRHHESHHHHGHHSHGHSNEGRNNASSSSSSSSGTHTAAINVASTDSDHDLVYWIHRQWSHPVTKTLTALPEGFHKATATDGTGLSLDFQRTTPKLLNFADGLVLPNRASGPNNDILDKLEPVLTDAINAKAKIYLFGSEYSDGGGGIHDIHMNQGDTKSYDNGRHDQHFEAVFLAFATQAVPTDDTGNPTSSSQELATIAKTDSSRSTTSSS
ncbi:Oxidoreductase NAD-binding domain family protein [Teratosphaeria destructans]|uniref:Oxidoreductase NAD-binding domain family protein n=1 Tax=Teratosphaeria destructans TaxID=418781 RepID=A0A9W7SNA2_9PEZI|nr:Oxidoreductase NAD-binding domain family protein [Teratosphaeria destructans]